MAEGSIRLRSSWIWLLGLFTFGSFIETVFYGQLTAFTPLYLPKLGIRIQDIALWTGLISSFSGLLGLPFLPFWGALADRYARKPIIIRSFIVELAAGIVSLLAGNIWIFILGRAITSLSLGNSGLMMTTLAERAPANRQGLAFSIMNSASPIGAFLGPLVGGPVVDHFGFPTLMAIDAGLLLTVVLALTFGYKDYFVGTNRGSLLRMALDSIKIILRSQRIRALFVAMFALYAGWILALTYVPIAVGTLYQGPDPGTAVGLVLGASGVAALFLGPLIGVLADRYGHLKIVLIGAAAAVVLWPIPALVGGLVAFGAAWAVINGLTAGVFAVTLSVLSSSTTTEIRGRVMSFAYLPLNVGLVLGPAIGSLVTRSSVFAVFPTAAVLTALGVGLLLIARKK